MSVFVAFRALFLWHSEHSFPCHSEHFFSVIPSASEESSMDAYSEMHVTNKKGSLVETAFQ